MKQPLVLMGITLLLLCCGVSASAATKNKQEVVVYNWSEFIPQDVLDDFTKETGIKVVYSTFESNEAMFAKVKLLRGKPSYDVVVPSGYFLGKMVASGQLLELDHAKLPLLSNLDESLRGMEVDPDNKYSVPYMWGVVGLAYNSKYIPQGSVKSWNDLLRPEYKGRVILTDDLRDAFGLALLAKGYSVNTKDSTEITAGYEFLQALKPSIRVFDVTAIKQALISEEVWIGPIWNGDWIIAQEENPALEFVAPEEGLVGWMDSFVILHNAPNVDNAYTFINYMLRPEVAKRCVEEFKYSTPNKKALDLLPADLRENAVLVPSAEQMQHIQFPVDLGSTLQEYEKYWEQLKTMR